MKVSIIIPVYNAERTLERCIGSVLRQTYPDVEAVLVDDASTDRSRDILYLYRKDNPRIRIVEHERNQGSMLARQNGCMAATGEYILFLDADDELTSDAVQCLVEARGDADIVCGSTMKIYADGRTEMMANEPLDTASHSDIYRNLLTEQLKHSLCGKLFKATLFRAPELKFYEGLTISEDGCMFYQLVQQAHRLRTIAATVYLYIENKQSSTHATYTLKEVESIIIANKIMTDCCMPYEELQEQALRRCTFKMMCLYAERVPRAEVTRLLKKHGMQRYIASWSNFRLLDRGQQWFLLKRYVYVRLPKQCR